MKRACLLLALAACGPPPPPAPPSNRGATDALDEPVSTDDRWQTADQLRWRVLARRSVHGAGQIDLTLVDAATGEPVEDAIVVAIASATTQAPEPALTDPAGHASLSVSYDVAQVSVFFGALTFSAPVDVTEGEHVTLALELDLSGA